MNFTENYAEPVSFRKLCKDPQELLLINEKYQQCLTRIGFTNFDAVWSFAEGEIIKKKGERTVIRAEFPGLKDLELQSAQGAEGNVVFYLKKHCQRLSLWQRLLRPKGLCGEGPSEFQNYCQFRQNGLATADPVAAGIRFSSFLQVDSFLVTRDFAPLTALEEIVLQRPAILQGHENELKKKNILRAIGLYARRMHGSGMNQKDFNATHILLQNLESNFLQVALFDLQRVDHNPLNRFRWPIKALAELNYTLPPGIFSESDRIFLFSAYKDKKNLSPIDRWQYRLIMGKTARIARHTQKRGLAPKMPSLD